MDSTMLLIVVFIFDLIAFALAVAAEQRRSTAVLLKWHSHSDIEQSIALKSLVQHIVALHAISVLQAKIVQDPKLNYNYCVYDSDIATGFGVGSFLFLMSSQALIMVASRCFCCGKALSPGRSRAWAMVLFITCWVTFYIAEVCLLAGSSRNAYHTKYRTVLSDVPPSCQTLRKGVFGAGAAFIVFTGILTKFYYVCYSKAKDSFSPPYGSDTGVRMGTYN
ncbi:hypothetical protein HHK36_001911 [Tetracentron sinense]|uniref:Fiber protein Fb34 n=1 Tax=Tetracentron sinense TaxID=13715 RepID=A0A834ZU73_TETSI|nr:hypothetical protein HHK36_001911 [Tetracentron sinense]